MSYDWQAALVFFVSLVVLTGVGRFLVFKIPDLQRMRELNREEDRRKLSRKRFREAVAVNNRVGLLTNAVFFVTLLLSLIHI